MFRPILPVYCAWCNPRGNICNCAIPMTLDQAYHHELNIIEYNKYQNYLTNIGQPLITLNNFLPIYEEYKYYIYIANCNCFQALSLPDFIQFKKQQNLVNNRPIIFNVPSIPTMSTVSTVDSVPSVSSIPSVPPGLGIDNPSLNSPSTSSVDSDIRNLCTSLSGIELEEPNSSTNQLPIYEVKVVKPINGKNRRNTISESSATNINPSSYEFSPNKEIEKEFLENLRSKFSTDDCVLCATYVQNGVFDTQFLFTETAKRTDKRSIDTAIRCLYEEICQRVVNPRTIDIGKHYEYEISNNGNISTKKRQVFTLDLNKNPSIQHVFLKGNEDETNNAGWKTKAMVAVVGKADKLKEIVERAKPNDGIVGYYIIPVFHPILDEQVR